MKTNLEVVSAFIKHEPAHNRSMSSDGWSLYSYGTIIGEWFCVDGKYTLVVNFNRYSQTTTVKHQAPLRYQLNRVTREGTPILVIDNCHKFTPSDTITVMNEYVTRGCLSLGEWYNDYKALRDYNFAVTLKGGV